MLAALRRQLRTRRAALEDGARRVGWKIGGDIAEIDALTGSAPVIGYLTTASLVPAAGIHDASGARALRAETELVIELATPDSIAGVGVAIELVDVARPPDTMESIVAANVSTGPRSSARRAGLPSRRAPGGGSGSMARCARPRRRRPTSSGPSSTSRGWLDALGERLRAGDRILAGSLTHVPVATGDEVQAEIDGLDRLDVTIAS